MVFLRTKAKFAKNYNKLKENTTAIGRNVRESVDTGLEIINAIEKDTKDVYHQLSRRSKPYYNTAHKYIPNRNLTKKYWKKIKNKKKGGITPKSMHIKSIKKKHRISNNEDQIMHYNWGNTEDEIITVKKTKYNHTPMRDAIIKRKMESEYRDLYDTFNQHKLNSLFEEYKKTTNFGTSNEENIRNFLLYKKLTNMSPEKTI